MTAPHSIAHLRRIGKETLDPSIGERRFPARTRPCRPRRARLKALLCEVAQTIARMPVPPTTPSPHLSPHRALALALPRPLAVAHALPVILYHMLRDHTLDIALGADYFERLDTERLQHRYVQRLEYLGYSVTRTPVPAA